MKLAELNPKWATRWSADARTKTRIGVRFDCPVCLGKPPLSEDGFPLCSGVVYVPFSNPLDDGPTFPTGWHREGDSFETLSLHPSVWFHRGLGPKFCEWHGHVRTGDVFTL